MFACLAQSVYADTIVASAENNFAVPGSMVLEPVGLEPELCTYRFVSQMVEPQTGTNMTGGIFDYQQRYRMRKINCERQHAVRTSLECRYAADDESHGDADFNDGD